MPDADNWLTTDEGERITLVSDPIYAVYLERLKKFSAKAWLDSGQ